MEGRPIWSSGTNDWHIFDRLGVEAVKLILCGFDSLVRGFDGARVSIVDLMDSLDLISFVKCSAEQDSFF